LKLDLSRWSAEQRLAIETRGQNVLVSAGAGSGKTSVLVERVVHCVVGSDGTDLQRLLVVTFTEAAAAEMRKRINDRLEKLYQQAQKDGDSEAARRLSQQLAQVEQAQISTLHSFCMQVVRNNFLFLGLEPVFSLMAEDDVVLLKAEVLESLVEQVLAGPERDALARVITRFAGSNPQRFSKLVFRLHTFAVSQPHPLEWLQGMADRFADAVGAAPGDLPWMPQFLAWVRRQVAASMRDFAAARDVAVEYEELASYAENLVQLVNLCEAGYAALATAEGLDTAALSLRAALGLKSPRAKDHPAKELVTGKRTAGIKRLQSLVPLLERGLAALHQDVIHLQPDVATLVRFVKSFHERYQQAKRERGQLDFNDLEHYALQALQDPASGEAKRLQEHFVEVFVDEYQDTSPIQDAIVSLITRPEGNQFVVGDVKQSIYRFRMAEPNLFLHKYETLGDTAPGRVIDLSANYRSRAEVVNAVNFLFEQLFSLDFGGIVYDERAKMRVGATYPDDSDASLAGPVEFHLIARDGGAAESEVDAESGTEVSLSGEAGEELAPEDLSAIEREATVIAGRILELMGQAPNSVHRTVWDAKLGAYRPLQYRDIVILLRSVKTRMTPVLEVLRRFGIPAYGATSTGFYGSLEVGWLLSALSAIDNPRRELDFATLLRSPIGGFQDEDLARIRAVQKRNFFDAWKAVLRVSSADLAARWETSEAAARALQAKVQAFMHRFSTWRSKARKASTEDVLRQILDDTELERYVAGMKGGDVRRANIQVLLEKARSFDRASTDGVYGFVNFAAAALKHDVDVGEARTLGENEDVVRVMTIHQSKGLEFPVVFVADLGKQFYRDPLEASFPLHRELGFGPQCVDPEGDQKWPTIASLAIEDLEHTEFLAEEARVLYVALTRAREKLILVGSARNLDKLVDKAVDRASPQEHTLPADALLEAKSCLDWLLPALCRHRDGGAIRSLATDDTVNARVVGPYWDHPARFHVQLWDVPMHPRVSLGEVEAAATTTKDKLRWTARTVDDVLRFLDNESRSVSEATDWVLTSENDASPEMVVPGKVSATDLRRLWVAKEVKGRKSKPLFQGAAERMLEDPRFVQEVASPRESGIAFHAVMQYLDFSTAPDVGAVTEAIDALVRTGRLHADVAAAVHVEDVVAFLASPIGQRLARAKRVMREQPFFQRLDTPAAKRSRATDDDVTSFAVAQGVIDCLAQDDQGWILVDYKTDNIGPELADAKAEEYAAQVAVYLDAASALTKGEPISAYLYFVRPRVFVEMGRMNLSVLFESYPEPK
jgi:ATP-dependent helicase/nuclease subunit A